jgi:hypothetical protein
MALDKSRVKLALEQALNDAWLAATLADTLFAQSTALTAQLTTITHTAAGTPDYAIQDLTDTGGFGFATADEGNTVLAVVANLQARLAQVETALETAGLVAAN